MSLGIGLASGGTSGRDLSFGLLAHLLDLGTNGIRAFPRFLQNTFRLGTRIRQGLFCLFLGFFPSLSGFTQGGFPQCLRLCSGVIAQLGSFLLGLNPHFHVVFFCLSTLQFGFPINGCFQVRNLGVRLCPQRGGFPFCRCYQFVCPMLRIGQHCF